MPNSPTLIERSSRFRRDTAARVPGRLAELIELRVARLLRDDGARLPDDLTDAEMVVIAVVEQFMIDVHGLSDGQFAQLGEHYAHDEQVAIMFHLALVDGFAKLDRVQGLPLERVAR